MSLQQSGSSNFVVDGGSTTLTINGTLARKTTGTVGISLTNGALLAYGSGSKLDYTPISAANQTVGAEWTSTLTPDTLIINNSSGVTITSGRRFVSRVLQLTSGELSHSTAGDTLYLGGNLVGGLEGGGVHDTTNRNAVMVFNGTQLQTITGSAKIYKIIINKPYQTVLNDSTVSLGSSAVTVTSEMIVQRGRFVNTSGTLTIQERTGNRILVQNNAVFEMSTGSNNLICPLVEVTGTATIRTGGKTFFYNDGGGSPNSNFTLSTSSTFELNGSLAAENLPATVTTYGKLRISNANNVNLSATSITVDSLIFTTGRLFTESFGNLTVNSGILDLGGASFVVGPLRRRINDASAHAFPVGISTFSRPATFDYVNYTGAVNPVIEIKYFNTNPTGNKPSGVNAISSSAYYTVKLISGTQPTTDDNFDIALTYTDGGFNPESRYRLVRQIASLVTNPSYELLTGEVRNEAQDQITVANVSGLPTNDGIFTFGSGGATVKWDGGQGDGQWTSQANWDFDVLPGQTDSVVLDNSIVGGNYTVTLSGTTGQDVLALTIGDDGANTVTLNITNTNGTPLSVHHATALTGLRVLSDGTLTINGTTGGLGFINNAGVNFENGSTFNITTGTGFSTSGAQTFGATSNTTISSITVSTDVKGSNFGNLTLSPGGTLNWEANFQAQGNVTITANTVTVNTDATSHTASIGGNLNANGGTFTLNNGSVDQDLTVTGNINVGGGTLNLTSAGGGATVSAVNLNITLGTFRMVNGGGGSPTLTLTGNFAQSGGTFTSVSTGAPAVNLAGNFTSSAGVFTHTNGTFVFNGTAQQTINNGVTFNSLTINNTRAGMNPDDIEVLANLTITGTLTLTDGIVDMNANTMILNAAAVSTVASSTSFINGQMRRFFSNTANNLTFHTGKDTLYRPVTISGTVTGGPDILVNQIEIGNSIPLTTGLSGALVKVSRIRNWQLTYTSNGGTFTTPIITLTYNNLGRQTTSDGVYPITGAAVANDVSIAHQPNQTGLWLDLEGNLTGTFTITGNGTVASVNALTFVSGQTDLFTFGATNSDVSLPVELSQFEAYEMEKLGHVKLQWKTESEVDNAYWLVQRKKGSADFITIANVKGQGTKTNATLYEFLDSDVNAGDSLTYRLADVSYAGTITYHEAKDVAVAMPAKFELLQNYPNPFNPVTTIAYKLPQSTKVSISVYNVLGQKVRELVRGEVKGAGTYRAIWDGKNDAGVQVASGIYIYRLEAGQFRTTRKMFFIK
ncbi:T9SS type A sorting domain-containing protein [bacterium]|nr:T9SS type A sorting domain-containing protein [bacterium]